ncbi:hypothetical protein HIM_03305 [Hirsutella minnesotensis 3608]|nr:hypothetical protein HIM_03305 [Hirsutella minnesotensis 3608]
MGSSSSKAVSTAGRAAAPRRFPARTPDTSGATSAVGAAQRPRSVPEAVNRRETAHVAPEESEQISGAFSRRLHNMGIVKPNPAFPPSSQAGLDATRSDIAAPKFAPVRHNVTLSVLEARRGLEQQADDDLENAGRQTYPGRQLLDMRTVVDAMGMRNDGMSALDIETRLGLKPGVLSKLSSQEILTHLSTR